MGEPRFSPSVLHAAYTRGARTGNSAPGSRTGHEWHESKAKSTRTHSRVAAMKTLMWRLPGRLHSAGVLTPLVVVVTGYVLLTILVLRKFKVKRPIR